MIAAAVVTVLVDGRIVEGTTPATLRHNVVVSPISPYTEEFAERIASDPGRRFVIFERAGRTIRVPLAYSPVPSGTAAQSVSIAPYLRAEEPRIPLAAVARALGAWVAYDAATRTLQIDVTPEPLATMTPFATWSPPPGPLPTFTPTPAPAPQPTLTGIPSPRRTPLLIEPEFRKTFP